MEKCSVESNCSVSKYFNDCCYRLVVFHYCFVVVVTRLTYNMNMDNFEQGEEKSDYEVATEAFQACKSSIEKERKKTWLKGITYRQCPFVPWYKIEVQKEVPENIQSTDLFSEIEQGVKKLIPSIKARCALQEMVNIITSIIDIFFFVKLSC